MMIYVYSLVQNALATSAKKKRLKRKQEVQIFHDKYCKTQIMKQGEKPPSTAEGERLLGRLIFTESDRDVHSNV